MGAVELSAPLSAVGDFNGDGREDKVLFDGLTHSLQVSAASAASGGYEIGSWGLAPSEVTALSTFVVGDFNGDGRDDLLISSSGVYQLAISDGSTFLIQSAALPANWNVVYASDFDGDGSDEILGGISNAGSYAWSIADYRDAFGLAAPKSIASLSGFAPSFQQFFKDVNRDGRADVITRTSGSAPWMVRLSGAGVDGAPAFAAAADWNAWINYGYNAATATLDADKALAKVIEEFSWVYNNVELELYPGLMKGPTATEQTKAGNDWDQAALLVRRLEAAGFEANIATGLVQVSPTQAMKWLGVTGSTAALQVIKQSIHSGADEAPDGDIRFKHAWVRVRVPTPTGLVWADVDPSWKFQDRPASLPDIPTELNEADFLLNLDRNLLPVEYFEDKVMQHLISNSPGVSLAEAAYDGPILQKFFSSLPLGMAFGVEREGALEEFNNFTAIVETPALRDRLTHRATVSLDRNIDDLLRTTQVTLPSGFTFGDDYPPGAKYVDITSSTIFRYNYQNQPNGGAVPVSRSASEFETAFNPEGDYLDLDNGVTQYFAVQIPGGYKITDETRMVFRMRTSPANGYIVWGVDTDLSSLTGVPTQQYIEYGPVYTSSEVTDKVSYFSNLDSNVGTIMQYVVFGHHGASEAQFGSIILYEEPTLNRSGGGTPGFTFTTTDGGKIIVQQKGGDYRSIAFSGDGQLITPGTALEIEYKSTAAGGLVGVGWDVDLFSGNNAGQPSRLFKIGGTGVFPAYSTNFTSTPSTDGYTKFTLPIGSSLSAGQTATLRRIVLHSDRDGNGPASEGYFRNIALKERSVGADSTHVSTTVVVPKQSLSSIAIDYVKTENISASQLDDTYRARLSIDGVIVDEGGAGEFFQVGDKAKLKITHAGPSDFTSTTGQAYTYSRDPGQILAVSFDANQYSHQHLVNLQSNLNSLLLNGDDVSDIDELLNYTAAKYWYEFNRSNRSIDALMRTISAQQWVGSGVVTADPYLLTISQEAIAHLQFPIVPHDLGVDLPNVNHVSFDVSNGNPNSEAFQLVGFNSSALENAVIEEVLNTESISTVRGIDDAFQVRPGFTFSGEISSENTVQVFESVQTPNGRVIYFRGELGLIAWRRTPFDQSNASVRNRDSLMYSENGGLKHHDVEAAQKLIDVLENVTRGVDGQIARDESGAPIPGEAIGTIRVLVPRLQSRLEGWKGTVYVAEYETASGRRGAYTIVPDEGPSSSGGYGSNSVTPKNTFLPDGSYTYATYMGDPVNVANGNMFRDETDIAFANAGLPLTFTRHYDAQSKDDFGMGVGWMYAFGDVVYEQEGKIVWLDALGKRSVFEPTSTVAYAIPASLAGKITSATASAVAIVFKSIDGIEYHFEKVALTESSKAIRGRLSQIVDLNGYGVRVVYRDQVLAEVVSRKILRVEDVRSAARNLAFTYQSYAAGTNHIQSISKVNPGSTTVAWFYAHQAIDANRYLTSVQSPSVLVASAALVENYSNPTVQYAYYTAAGHYSKGLLQRIAEPDGAWQEYEYFANGRAFRIKQGDANQLPSDSNIDVQTFSYNLYRDATEFTDELGHVEAYFHRRNGLLAKQIHADRSQIVTSWGAPDTTAEFQMLGTRDERGASEAFVYYSEPTDGYKKGLLKESLAKKSNGEPDFRTTYDYSRPAGLKFHVVVPTTTIVDKASSIADPGSGFYVGQKLTTTRQYYTSGEAAGHLWRVTDAQGNAIEYDYYASTDSNLNARRLLKSVKYSGVLNDQEATVFYETLFEEYDATGNPTKTTTRNLATLAIIATSATSYDSLGNVIRAVDPTNVVTESVFDALGRLRETGYGDANPAIDPIDAFTSRFKYDAVGRVRESIDPLGRSTKFEYDRQGNIARQINPDGTILLREYDAFGNCVAVTDALDRTTRFVYDNRNRLVQTLHPDGAVERLRYDGAGNVVGKIDALGNATTFKYDGAGRLIETKLPDPDGPANAGAGTLTEPTTTNKYDKLGNLVETIDPKGNVTQFKYDKLGRVVQTQTLKGVNGNRAISTPWVVTGTLQSLTTTDYDAAGNVVKTAVYDVSLYDAAATSTLLADPRAQQTPANIAANKVQVVAMRYDALGRLVKTINADGTTTSTDYDAAGRVRYQHDELNRVTEFRYDVFGRLDKTLLPDPVTGAITGASPTTSYRYDAAGNRIATTDPRGFTTQFKYDVFNRPLATVDANGNRSRVVYDAAGQVVANADALGRADYTLYDARGRVLQHRLADPDGSGLNAAPVTQFRYDAAGRVVEEIDALGNSTYYEHDRLGRVVKETFTTAQQTIDAGDPGFTYYAATATPASQSSDYGNDSLLISPTTTPAAHEMLWKFEGLEPGTYRVLAHWSGQPTATTGLVYRLSDYYDETLSDSQQTNSYWPHDEIFGNVNQRAATFDVVRSDGDVAYGWNVLHAGFKIDAGKGPGWLGVHFAAASGAIHADAIRIERIASRSFEYDANGNLQKETNPLSDATTYAYDEFNRLVVKTLPDPDGSTTTLISPQTTTAYDGYGNVKSVLERRGNGLNGVNQRKTTYAYDARNRRTTEVFDADNGSAGVTYLNRTTTFDYDDVGNLTEKIELPGHALQRRTTYGYDKLDRLIEETHNADAALASDRDVTKTVYDQTGNVKEVQRNPGVDPRAIKTINRYDAVGQLVEQTEQGLFDSSLSQRTTRFQYDAVGNQVAAIDPMARRSRSEFDRLDRLVRTTDPDPDGAGSLQSHATVYVYDAAGQLILKNNGANLVAGSHEIDRYAYHPQGRLVRSEDGRGDVTTRRYDDAGNLIKLVDPAGNATDYSYDNLDRMLTETTAAGTHRFIYDINGNLAITVDRDIPDGNGNMTSGWATKYAYGRDDQVYATWEYENLTAAQIVGSQAFIAFTSKYYDALGRLEEERYARRNGFGNTFTLDYRATDSYRYDGLDRLVERSNQSVQLVNPLHSSGPATKQTYAYAYDSVGLIVTRQQFIANQLETVTYESFNPFGELWKVTDGDPVSGTGLEFGSRSAPFTYDAAGALTSTLRLTNFSVLSHYQFNNHIKTIYGYDGAGRLDSLIHRRAQYNGSPTLVNTAELLRFTYDHDSVSRISSIETDWNTAVAGFSTRVVSRQEFTFDAAGQLNGVYVPYGDEEQGDYWMTTNGRRSVSSDASGLLQNSYDPGNRLSQDGRHHYAYDAEGNLERVDSLTDDSYAKYYWDDRNRLIKAELFDANAALKETVKYRYNNANDLIYRAVTPAGETAQAEFYVNESGQRTMTIEADGDVKHRYLYGSTGEVLFDQVFNAAGAPTLQPEQEVLEVLGDHQQSTRAVIAGSNLAVRQSVTYAPFGMATAIYDAAGMLEETAPGVPDLNALDTVFSHHGSVLDPTTELQLKGERWYTPEVGRFISEDPIQEGSNWYMFAGNDPVNYADPSGLSLQGYPLAGGYSGNVTRKPTIGQGYIPANTLSTVGTPSGHATSHGVSTRLTSSQILNNFTTLNDLSSMTRATGLEHSLKASSPNTSIRDYQLEQMRQAMGRAHAEELNYVANRNAIYAATFADDLRDTANIATSVGPQSDVRDAVETITGYNVIELKPLSTSQRVVTGVSMLVPLVGGVVLRRLLNVGEVAKDAARASEFGESSSSVGYHVAPKRDVKANKAAGDAREAKVQGKLESRFGRDAVQNELSLRNADGTLAKDPLTGEGRRVDHVVIQDGQGRFAVETTSKTADKSAQLAKESRIRSNGGAFVRDRSTGALIDLQNVPTRVIRVK